MGADEVSAWTLPALRCSGRAVALYRCRQQVEKRELRAGCGLDPNETAMQRIVPVSFTRVWQRLARAGLFLSTLTLFGRAVKCPCRSCVEGSAASPTAVLSPPWN